MSRYFSDAILGAHLFMGILITLRLWKSSLTFRALLSPRATCVWREFAQTQTVLTSARDRQGCARAKAMDIIRYG